MSLLSKLRFQPTAPVYAPGDAAGASLLQGDAAFLLMENLPAGKGATLQQVILFARDAAGLRTTFAKLAPRLADKAVLWIAYPKKSGAIKSDLTRDKGWEQVSEWGYIGVSQASLDDDWSGLWFKKAEALKKHLRATPMHERVTEGVDYKARTVSLPADAADALDSVTGLSDFFNGLSFSHRREWAEAIADAKKSETRVCRILKMVDELVKQQQEKSANAAAKTTS